MLDTLAGLIEAPDAINGTLSRDDLRVMPLLRQICGSGVTPIRAVIVR